MGDRRPLDYDDFPRVYPLDAEGIAAIPQFDQVIVRQYPFYVMDCGQRERGRRLQ